MPAWTVPRLPASQRGRFLCVSGPAVAHLAQYFAKTVQVRPLHNPLPFSLGQARTPAALHCKADISSWSRLASAPSHRVGRARRLWMERLTGELTPWKGWGPTSGGQGGPRGPTAANPKCLRKGVHNDPNRPGADFGGAACRPQQLGGNQPRGMSQEG